MLSLVSSALVGLGIVVLLRLAQSAINSARTRRHLPPGPPGLPFLGNIFDMKGFAWDRFTEWKEQYGPIFSLNFAGLPVVVLNDFSVTADLTDRRSAVFSDRPRMIMVGEIMSKDMLLTMTRYNDRWRKMRKVCHEAFNGHVVKKYRPVEEMHARVLLSKLLKPSKTWEDEIAFSLGSLILRIVYGLTPEEIEKLPEILHGIDDFIDRLSNASKPGEFFVDFFPWMLYIPRWMAPWKTYGEKCLRKDTEFFTGLLHEARSRMTESVAGPTFCSAIADAENSGDLNESEAAWLAGVIYAAGMETTTTALIVFVLAMIHYPDVMQRAQKQIDNVVGHDRLPTFADHDDLVYVQAIIREILRWRPPAPLALPKRCTQDNWYNGYFIPEGTMILENVWGMNHDPKYFPDPSVFRPERHLDSNGNLAEPLADTHGFSHGSFGSGRRICVGKDLAYQALWINITFILWGTNILPALDENGKPNLPPESTIVERGVVVRPPPFPCTFTSRSKRSDAVLEAALDEAYTTWGFA